MSLTFKDVDDILKLIDQSDFAEIKLEFEGLALHVIRKGAVALDSTSQEFRTTPIRAPEKPTESLASPAKASGIGSTVKDPLASASEVPAGMIAVRAPLAGTCYRAPSPGATPFVDVGQVVSATDTICLIEVMKLFKSVNAGVKGRVAAILFSDATPIAREQPLVLIEPIAP